MQQGAAAKVRARLVNGPNDGIVRQYVFTPPQLMRLSRVRTVTLSCTLLTLIIGYRFGGTGVAVALGFLALPALAWAFDNASGTFLVLATLFVITIGIMVLLIALMAITH